MELAQFLFVNKEAWLAAKFVPKSEQVLTSLFFSYAGCTSKKQSPRKKFKQR